MTTELKYSPQIRKKLEGKSFILQFLPKELDSILSSEVPQFREKDLKRGFLIDIVHTLLLKFYFKKENRFNLSSIILKSRYGQYYNYYMDFLLSHGILEIVKKHQKGVNARIYKLADRIIDGDIGRYSNRDSTLLKKYKNAVAKIEQEDIESNLIDPDVKRKLIDDLFSVTIKFDEAKSILQSSIRDHSIFNRNLYSVESINQNHIFYHFDNYGRVHTNFTILKSTIRKNCLLIAGEETCEIDIKNSQPFFLCKLIESYPQNPIDSEEYGRYKSLVLDGMLYEVIMGESNMKRSEAKDLIYKVFFGLNRSNSKSDIIFKKIFPSIHNFIKKYKKERGNYKIFSHTLQNLESDLIFNNIVKEIMYIYPEIKLVTIHDSIICQKRYQEIVESIFQKNIKKILT